MKSSESRPVNLGNPVEHSVLEIAKTITDNFEASETNELWVPNAPTLRIGIGMREKPLGLAGEAKW